MPGKQMKTPQIPQKSTKKKNQHLQIAEQVFMNVLSLYCTFYTNTLKHFRTINKKFYTVHEILQS